MSRELFLFFLTLLLLVSPHPLDAAAYSLQVGASGGAESIGSLGVRAEIRTRLYQVNPPESDAFWVGNHLDGGAFIQFGYELDYAGAYCDRAKVEIGMSSTCFGKTSSVNGSEALWSWQYWPNGSEYYYDTGNLSGNNGTWHLYTIMPNPQGGWTFLLDSQQVANATLPQAKSSYPATFLAEKITTSMTLGKLGPVEFRNLAYLKQDGWHPVTALSAIVTCGAGAKCIPFTYGVCLKGPNHIIAGSSVNQPRDGQQLWNGTTQTTESNQCSPTTASIQMGQILSYSSLAAGLIVVLVLIKLIVLPRRRKNKRARVFTQTRSLATQRSDFDHSSSPPTYSSLVA